VDNQFVKKIVRRVAFDREVLKLMIFSVTTKPIGLIFQVLLAKYYGAGFHYDAYLLSFFLVNFLAKTLTRVFAAVTIPYLTTLKLESDERRLNEMANATILIFMAPMVVYSILLMFKGNVAVGLISANAPDQTIALTGQMLKIMALPGILIVFIESMNSIFNRNKIFRIAAAMPIIDSVTMLLILVLGHKAWGIWALPIAFSVSQVLRAVVSIGFAISKGVFRIALPQVPLSFLRELWSRSWMVLLSSAILAANMFVDKFFAAGLVEGSISSIAYSMTLVNFGLQIFQISLVTVMFTHMSEYIARKEMNECGNYIELNFRKLAALVVPISIAVSIASPELVRVLFQRDAFSIEDAERTSSALSMYMLGMPALLLNLVIARVYHSLGKLRVKIWLAVQYIVTNVVGNILLIGPLKVTGLAVSSSLAINLHLGLSLFILFRYRLGLRVGSISMVLIRHYLYGVLTWVTYWLIGVNGFFDHLVQAEGWFVYVGIGAARGLSVLIIYAVWFLALRNLLNKREA